MSATSRRELLALSLRGAAGAAAGSLALGAMAGDAGALALPPEPSPALSLSKVDRWGIAIETAIAALRSARAEEAAAEARFKASQPDMPAEIFVTIEDHDLGLSGDPVSDGRGGWRRDRRGALLRATDSHGLRACADALGDCPALAARFKARLPAVERYEAAWIAAEDRAGLPTAQEAPLAACGIIALAESASSQSAARDGQAVRLARLVAGDIQKPKGQMD